MGILLIGGKSYQAFSSVEVLGFDNCSVPDLPEWRYNHGSFLTEWGALAVCGGFWEGKPLSSSDCLVLNSALKQWERGILGDVLGGTVLGVVSLNAGTYMIHPFTSSFLPSGEHEWIAGPAPQEEVQCATGISSTSFLFISNRSVHEFDSSLDWLEGDSSFAAPRQSPSVAGTPEPGNQWPDLRAERYRPACTTFQDMVIVAGGRNNKGGLLNSVEIIYLDSKGSRFAKNMPFPFDFVKLVVLSSTLVMLGGTNQTSVYTWQGAAESWREASQSLATSRTHFSALVTTDEVCSNGPLPPHSCSTVDGGTCVFPFTNGNFSLMKKHQRWS